MRTTFRSALVPLAVCLTIALAGGTRSAGTDGDSASENNTHRVDAGETTSQQRAATLDEKFRALKAASSEATAEPIAAGIWQLWLRSGDAVVDEMMQDAITASKLGARDRALMLIEEVLKRKPEFAEAWNQRATIRFFEGRYDEALADCAEVMKRNPRHFGALAGMAVIATSQERYAAALLALRRAIDLHPFLKERDLLPFLETKVDGKPL